MSIELIRRFEPILYFHKDESFFPSDAKRFLEQCSLWEAKKPFEDKISWKQRIPPRSIAGSINEISQPGEDDDTYLGERDGATFPFLITNDQEERFLNPSGWISDTGAHEFEVTASTRNRFAALQRLARLYGNPQADVTIPDLRDSRFWYHAETFDASRLSDIAEAQTFTPVDLNLLLAKFNEPFIICYYLFYPGHIEGLQGCETVATGPNFGSFAGEWTCITILLDRDNPDQEFQAKFLGLASRNGNKDGEANASGRVFNEQRRVGMVIHDWSEADVFATSPSHVRLFVAKGTHCLYTKPGSIELQPKVPGDPTRESCGLAEPLTPTVTEGGEGAYFGVYLAKIVASAAALTGLGVGVIGVVVGLIWSILEDKPALHTPFDGVDPPPTPGDPQMDFPPEEGQFGIILHPADFEPPDATTGNPTVWPKNETIEINQRTYSILVDRTNPDEVLRQIWFPAAFASLPGYEGRWGPRVSPDPVTQRTGMRFPPFVEMFLLALAKHFS